MSGQSRESTGAFIGLASTEIRSTLTTITGLHTLLQETSLSPEQQAYIASAQKSTGKLLSLVSDLADFSLIEAGEFSFESMQFNLRTAVESVMEGIARKSAERTSEIHTLIHASVPELVVGDPARIRRIITTLVETALAFSPSGEIVLSVKAVEEDTERTVVRFDINEFGVGLSAGQLETLLRPFTHPDEVTSLKYGHTGLGLALTKRLAQLMGGQIGLSNAGGKGSTFWFSVGLKKVAEGASGEGGLEQSLEGMNVLIADPSPSGRRILVHYLESAGCNCMEYDHGEDVLMELEHSAPADRTFDAVLLAMQEVGTDGYRLVDRMKANPVLARVPMVLVTAIGQRGDAQKMKDLGVAAYLTRPLKQAELISCMRMVRQGSDGGTEGAADGAGRELITRHTIAETDAGRKFRILVADDNAVNRKRIRKLLDKAGYACDIAENGVDALNSFRVKPYDLILMDCEMPICNGYDAVRHIRKEEVSRGAGHHVPVCGLCAGTEGAARERCREAGMDDTLFKPLDPEAVVALIKKWEQSSDL